MNSAEVREQILSRAAALVPNRIPCALPCLAVDPC